MFIFIHFFFKFRRVCNRFCKAEKFDVASSARVSMLLHGGAGRSAVVLVSTAVGRCTKAMPARHKKLQPRRRLRCLRSNVGHVRELGDLSMLEESIQKPEDMRVHRLPPRLRLVVRPRQRVLRSRRLQGRRRARDDAEAQAVCPGTGVAAFATRGRWLRPAAHLAAVVGRLRVLLSHASG